MILMRTTTACSILALLLLALGCASSARVQRSYDAANDQTTYKSQELTVVSAIAGGGLGSSASIDMMARANCSGTKCTPQTAQLVFSVNAHGNSSRIGMSDRSIYIEADGVEFRWSDMTSRDDDDQFATVTDVINIVEVDVEQLERIAKAVQVEGSVGNHTFRLKRAERKPLISFVNTLREGGTAASSPPSGS